MKNQERLRQNWNREGSRGAVREGSALLQGIVYCGVCGESMNVQHRAATEKRSSGYICQRGYQHGDVSICQSMTAPPVDAVVAQAFLEAASPASLMVATRVLDQIEENLAAQRRQREMQLEQARYEARLAQRQYDAADPENRLVTAELEKRWNDKLERVTQLEKAYTQAEQDAQWQLSAEERAAIARLSHDLPAIWNAGTTTNQDRKRLLRMAIESVQLDGITVASQIEVQIRWRSGTVTRHVVNRPVPGEWSLKTPTAAVTQIHRLAEEYSYDEIAEELNKKGLRTAFGHCFTPQSVGYICRRDGINQRKGQRKSEPHGIDFRKS